MDGLDEVPGLFHDQVHVLVRPGHLVQEGACAPDLDVSHLPVEILHGEGLPGLVPAHPPAGPVGGGVEGCGVAQPPHRVAAGPHGAGDESHLALPGGYGSLPGDEDVGPEVALPLGEVVAALDAFVLPEAPGQFVQRLKRPVCHFVAVVPGELLAPVQVGQVVLELRGVLDQVGQVPVGELNEPALHELPGGFDVEVGDLVADAPAARVEEGPDPALLVQGDLDEMVARAQGPQLSPPVLVRLVVEVQPAGPSGLFLQLPDPGGGRPMHAVVVPACGEGYPFLDVFPDAPEVVGQVVPLQGGLDRDHAAADVHAHCGGNDGPLCRDAGADGCAQPEVAVGHDRDVPEDERHLRDVLDLGQSLGLYLVLRDPCEGPFVYLRWHDFTSLAVDSLL